MTERPTTPIHSPKIPVANLEPSTPPSERKNNRLSAFLTTPDQSLDNLPYSPSLKRTNELSKLSGHNVHSPYHSALKTPRPSGYESDEENNKLKVQKTPTYFSPGRKLFDNESKEREELSEITSQLKGKLSTALGKLQKQKQHKKDSYKFNFTELSFETSPTKKLKSSIQKDLSKPQTVLSKANYNLQNLTQSETPVQKHHSYATQDLQSSPFLEKKERVIDLPIADEENSAHNALMATLSRQQSKQKDHKAKSARPLSLDSYKLPPLNIALTENAKNFKFGAGSSANGGKKDTEQDAVYSLMSLSSPQSNKFSHSRTQSLNNNSTAGNSPVSRTSSVVLPLPSPIHQRNYSHTRDGRDDVPQTQMATHSPTKLPQISPTSPVSQLPPICGILGKNDEDATDIEDATDDDGSA